MTLKLQGIDPNGSDHVAAFLAMLAACLRLEVFVDQDGNVRRAAGPAAPAQAPFADMLDQLTGHSDELTIRVGSGQADAVTDNFDRREVDVGDLNQFPETAPANKPHMTTRCEMLIHVLAEYLHALDKGRNRGHKGYSRAHRAGKRAQNRHRAANGQQGEMRSDTSNRSQTSGTFHYSNGAETNLTIENGNITNVR